MKKIIHILLVEDDPDDVELLETAFVENDIAATFTVISQGDKVLPYLQENERTINLMLLDLNLPKVHGKEILTAIKSSELFHQIPVVILTTSSAQSDIDFCIQHGADYYFVKPTSLAEFANIVHTVIAIAAK